MAAMLLIMLVLILIMLGSTLLAIFLMRGMIWRAGEKDIEEG